MVPAVRRLGVDLGGTKIEGVVLGETGDTELVRRRVVTPSDYDSIIEVVCALVAGLERDVGPVERVGLGTPGAISPVTGLLENSNTLCLNGRPFDRDLATALQREVVLENDANCLALSEATDGAAAGASTVFAAILGTGVGGGLVVNGRLVRGVNAIAGEWGHTPLPHPSAWERPGLACYCGQRGCIETWLAGGGLAREMLLRSGHDLTAAEVAGLADQGVPEARESVIMYAERLARALSTIINVLDPEVIVLGGGLSNLAVLYEEVPRRWGQWVFAGRRGPGQPRSTPLLTRLVPARWGDSSGVRGAARL